MGKELLHRRSIEEKIIWYEEGTKKVSITKAEAIEYG